MEEFEVGDRLLALGGLGVPDRVFAVFTIFDDDV